MQCVVLCVHAAESASMAHSAGVLDKHGQAKAQRELLVGFYPVQHFVRLLEEALGHLLIVCADYTGGRTIGLRWHPQVL